LKAAIVTWVIASMSDVVSFLMIITKSYSFVSFIRMANVANQSRGFLRRLH